MTVAHLIEQAQFVLLPANALIALAIFVRVLMYKLDAEHPMRWMEKAGCAALMLSSLSVLSAILLGHYPVVNPAEIFLNAVFAAIVWRADGNVVRLIWGQQHNGSNP